MSRQQNASSGGAGFTSGKKKKKNKSSTGGEGGQKQGDCNKSTPKAGLNTSQWLVLGAVLLGCVSAVWYPLAAVLLKSREHAQVPPLDIGAKLGVVKPKIDAVIPHEDSCYTQGLIMNEVDGYLYESCGMYGESLLRRVCPRTGAVLATSSKLAKRLFAEGIHIVGGELVMLTWKARQLLFFDWRTLEQTRVLTFNTHTSEGWGISGNSTMLVVTDGSHWLHFWDSIDFREPASFKANTRAETIDSVHGIGKIRGLNEIEFVGEHELLANVYGEELIARIDARTGAVVGYYDFRGTLQALGDSSGKPEVMNGIAYDKYKGDVYVTGKWWRSMFKFNIKQD